MKYKMAAEPIPSLFEVNVAFDVLKRDSKLVIDYIEEHKEIMDAHMVDFFTLDHWETHLSPKISQELESLSDEDLTLLPSIGDKSESFGLENLGLELKPFILKARSAQLKTFPWVRDRRAFLSYNQQGFISHIMTPKKSYEVEMMSSVVNNLAKRFQVNKILDLGSGKGYLSQYLAMQYGLKVIGIDSSDSNTQNAIKRNERLLKAWEGLKKKCNNEKMNGVKPGEPSGVSSQTHDQWTVEATRYFVLSEQDEPQFGENIESGYERIDTPVENNTSAHQSRCTCRCSRTQLLSAKGCLQLTHIPEPSSQISAQQSLNMNSTAHNFCQIYHNKYFDARTSSTNVGSIETHRQRSAVSHMASGSVNTVIPRTGETQSSNISSFLPITGFVDHSLIKNGELARLFSELNLNTSSDSEDSGLFLVGLHTCGDLAPVALRIFVQEPCVKLLCIVGCCYHTVTQDFGSGDIVGDLGFPMSEFFRQFKPQLSRNATMVAQQAAERIASQAKLPPPSILYRAILQVILKEKYHLDCRGVHVGRIGAKCKDFNEYLRKSLNKLGLENEVLSDGDIEAYFERFRIKERQLLAFHQLRATIAPCIESVFLLDRLCYLYEQNTKWACIVKLFDPVKSPRCYAIIASKS